MTAWQHRLASLLGITLACMAVDQASKALFKHLLSDGAAVSLLGGVLVVLPSYNRGAFLSLGAALPVAWRNALLVYGVAALLVALLAWALRAKAPRRRDQWAVACIVGGGASNLFDRVHNGGPVFDFLNLGIGTLRTGIFNVADMAIMAGAALLLLDSLLGHRPAR
jgi:signal peptidase II